MIPRFQGLPLLLTGLIPASGEGIEHPPGDSK